MSGPIYVSLAVEGDLDEVVLRKALSATQRPFEIQACYGKRGKEHLRKTLPSYNSAARNSPFIVLADLDQDQCAPGLVKSWVPAREDRLLFRVAVREVESWLLADREGFSAFLGVSSTKIPKDPDQTLQPKLLVVNLARHSDSRVIREDVVPPAGGTSKVGRNYSGKLSEFVLGSWNVAMARKRSESFDRAFLAFEAIGNSFGTAG